MRISELLQVKVVDTDGRSLGRVRDLFVIQDGPLRSTGQAAFRVHGLVAGPFAFGTRLGYTAREGVEPTTETRGPLPVRAFFRWTLRHATYVPWRDIIEITDTQILISRQRS